MVLLQGSLMVETSRTEDCIYIYTMYMMGFIFKKMFMLQNRVCLKVNISHIQNLWILKGFKGTVITEFLKLCYSSKILHVIVACPRCISKPHVPAASICFSVLHVRSTFTNRMFMLHVRATCTYCMSILYFHAACPCCISMLNICAACPCQRRISLLHLYPCCTSMLRVFET